MGREQDAVGVLEKGFEFDPSRVDLLVLLGNLHLYVHQIDAADDVFNRAMSIAPQLAGVYLGLGRVLTIKGSIEQAQECFAKALTLDPTLPGATLHLARSRQFSKQDHATIESLESLLGHPGLSTSARSDLHFALGKIKDDCADYDHAFHHYEQANRLVATTLSFNREKFRRSLDLLEISFSPVFFETRGHSGQRSETPVFIVGMPRSGTTLVEQILASHPAVYGAGELPFIDQLTRQIGGPVGYPRSAIGMDGHLAFELSERYLRQVQALSESALRITDKMPTNFFHLGFIASLFPRARIIHCRREPLDTCLSLYCQQFETGHEWAYNLSDIAYFYNGYSRLMSHWKKVLPVAFYDIQYEQLITDSENVTRQLIEFCGLPWSSTCLEFYKLERAVLTSSNWQVRQPLYTQSIGRWRFYERHLDTLRRELSAT